MMRLSPSKPNPNRDLSPSGSEENDENDSRVDKLISQFENKIIHGKHLVSPRKKILAEINEIPSASNARNHEDPNLELDKIPPEKGVSDSDFLCYGRGSEQKDDSSVKVYDPLRNYLSPRPKYMRFNPSRRSEILKRLENECREESNLSPDSVVVDDEEESSAKEVEDSSLSTPKVCVVNPRTGRASEDGNDNVVDGYEEAEEEEEEIEEERGWSVRGVLKLLTLIVSLLSMLYFWSMNSPTVSPIQHILWNPTYKNGSLDFVSTKTEDDGFKVGVGGNHRPIEKVEGDEENYGEVDASFEVEIVENLVDESLHVEEEEDEKESSEVEEIVEKLEHLHNFEMDESLQTEEGEHVQESSEEIDERFEAKIIENLEQFEREMITKEMVGVAAKFESSSIENENENLIDTKIDENRDDGVIGLDKEVESSYKASETEIIRGLESEDSKGYMLEVEHVDELSDSMHETRDDTEVGKGKSGRNDKTVVGVSAIVVVLTSLAIFYHSKKSRKSTYSKIVEPALKHNSETVKPVFSSIGRKVEFLAREAPREITYHINAPTVELIGEIVVGKPTNNRGSTKYKMTMSEDESNVTLRSVRGSLPRPRSQSSATKLRPTTSNTSNGSFVTEIKMHKKEVSQSREATMETTPVRRSSRIRNRSAPITPSP